MLFFFSLSIHRKLWVGSSDSYPLLKVLYFYNTCFCKECLNKEDQNLGLLNHVLKTSVLGRILPFPGLLTKIAP